jgi:hypothetical protein
VANVPLSGGFSGGERTTDLCVSGVSLTTNRRLSADRSDQFDANSTHTVPINREIRSIIGKQKITGKV